MKPREQSVLTQIFKFARKLKQSLLASRPIDFCLSLVKGDGPCKLVAMLRKLTTETCDYAISCIYTILLCKTKRKELGAYFTPPHLVRHLLKRLKANGLKLLHDRLHDPAAGGAAFVVPLVREMVRKLLKAGYSHALIIRELQTKLSGVELDEGLACLANALIRRLLLKEYGINTGESFSLVTQGDSLVGECPRATVVIGNPPYRKVGAAAQKVYAKQFEDILGGQLNLYAMFLRRSMDVVEPGGLVGFVVPTSFLQGPEFHTLRIALLARADVLHLDLIDKRSDVFLDVIQDACFIVFRRHVSNAKTDDAHAEAGCELLRPDGSCIPIGAFTPDRNGNPWTLPSTEPRPVCGFKLSDYGYQCRVGYLVHNRQTERLVSEPGVGRVPLIRAALIRADGKLDFSRLQPQYVTVPPNVGYVVRRECVAIQRTANRKQARRINAAYIPQNIIDEHDGVVGENHVIFLHRLGSPKISPRALVKLLNSRSVNDRWASMSGTASISTKLLSTLDLPPPSSVRNLGRTRSSAVDEIVAAAYGQAIWRPDNEQSPSALLDQREADVKHDVLIAA